ncbi:phage tail protein [Mesorhizobium sp. BAC0120]|uniref:COG4223 family protein n=1 Tax=Mesorhizobium sp. BAC0120 TaxID=3090670 RepID=UPI00298C1D55|nr:phage tail protein [Mesorhizobium sp. BAC0120]MDW6022118.1 phage tail protein [Mesorhizobium sp. BAC0120]
MVKPPNIRHSKSRKEPMTIELGPDEVSRIEEPKRTDFAPGTDDLAAHTTSTESSVYEAEGKAESAVGQSATNEAPTPAEAAAGTDEEGGAAASGRTGQPPLEENASFIGSEWPPEPEAADAPPAEERVSHAFGRDPGTPPPSASTRVGGGEEPIRAPQPPQRRTVLPAIAAGVVGGVIALLAAGGLQLAGLLPSPDGSAAAPAGESQDVAALKSEMATLRQEVDAVKTGSGDTANVGRSVTDLSNGVTALSSSLDQVKADITQLKSAGAQGSAGDGAAVEALSRKIAELQSSVAALGEARSGVTQQTIDAINQKIAAVETALASATNTAKAGESRLAAIEQSVTNLSGQLTSLSDQVSRQAAQPKVALIIAGAALKSAIERGGPFTSEVETFAAIAPGSPELPALREAAAKGVESRDDLLSGMDQAGNAMIVASETPPENAGFWDRLVASAKSLVKVRPIGPVEGDTVAARVARMEVALKGGDLAKALSEYDSLPDASKAAGQAFAERIKARVAAEELVAKALADAMKSA